MFRLIKKLYLCLENNKKTFTNNYYILYEVSIHWMADHRLRLCCNIPDGTCTGRKVIYNTTRTQDK